MQARLNPYAAAPKTMQAMLDMAKRLTDNSTLDHRLVELVKIRASQINGCAFCLHMHTSDARGQGEREERIYLLSAWRKSNLYTPKERAALAWTEALTLVTNGHAPDDVYDEVHAQIQRGGGRETDPADHHDQRVEPHRNRLPLGASTRCEEGGCASLTEALLSDDDRTAAYLKNRPRLLGLAYRMVGAVSEAEDILQEAFLRWQAADRSLLDDPGAYLAKIVARLCLDHLKSARVRRESYVGPWLPEPMVEELPVAPVEAAQELSVALMLAMERLSPLERAVFLLHDIFDMGFAELSAVLERSEAACRQLAVRARAQVQHARSRFAVPPGSARALVSAFMAAARQGDVRALQSVLAEDVVLVTDGGGKRPAALNKIFGRDRIVRFFEGIVRKSGRAMQPGQLALVSGSPGYITLEPDGLLQTTALEVQHGRVRAIYIVRNPDKLQHLTGHRSILVA